MLASLSMLLRYVGGLRNSLDDGLTPGDCRRLLSHCLRRRGESFVGLHDRGVFGIRGRFAP
jgi:hypothetical protein